jgi:hypothetical protein
VASENRDDKNRTRQKNRFHSLFICDSHTARINLSARRRLRPQVLGASGRCREFGYQTLAQFLKYFEEKT